jgi:hypothetical protein
VITSFALRQILVGGHTTLGSSDLDASLRFGLPACPIARLKIERRKDVNCDLWLHAGLGPLLEVCSVRDNKHV